MSEQMGRHNATGPLARRGDGSVDPAGYIRQARHRHGSLILHSLLVVIWAFLLVLRAFGLMQGFYVLAGLLVADGMVVIAVRVVIWCREKRRRRAGLPPSWSAWLFVSQARSQGIIIPTSVRGDGQLLGRLSDHGDRWEWVARDRRGGETIPPILIAGERPPTVTAPAGSRGFATFDSPEPDGPRLDFWISRRRDLQRHLATSRSDRMTPGVSASGPWAASSSAATASPVERSPMASYWPPGHVNPTGTAGGLAWGPRAQPRRRRAYAILFPTVVFIALAVFLGISASANHDYSTRTERVQHHGITATGSVLSVVNSAHQGPAGSSGARITIRLAQPVNGHATTTAHVNARSALVAGTAITVLVDPRNAAYAELPGHPTTSATTWVLVSCLAVLAAMLALWLIAYSVRLLTRRQSLHSV